MKRIQTEQETGDAPVVAKKRAGRPKKVTAKTEVSPASESLAELPIVGELAFPEPASADCSDSAAGEGDLLEVEGITSEEAVSQSKAIESDSDLASIAQPETSGHTSRQIWCFLTNRTNLLTILAMGAITRSEQAWRYAPDSRDDAVGYVPLWRGAIPMNLTPLLEKTGADSPVILEFSDGLQDFIPFSPGATCVAPGPIPFAAVTRVRFKDRKTLDDFKLKSFDDTPIIPEQLFEDSLGISDSTAEVDFGASVIPEPPNFRLDKILGGLMAATEALAGRTAACRFYCALVDGLVKELEATDTFANSLAHQFSDTRSVSEPLAVDSDRWLLGETLRILYQVDPDVGLDPLAFIDEVEASIRAATRRSGGPDLSPVLAWSRYTKQLLNGNEEVKQLSDARNIVQRAVLLFLMRPEQHRFKKIEGSNINPGDRVYLLASVLMGHFVGLQRIDSPLKKTGRSYFEFVEHFIAHQAHGFPPSERARLVQYSDGRGEFAALHGELELARFEIKLNDSLQQVFHQVRRAGLQSRYRFVEQEVWCSLPSQGDVDVKIGVLSDPAYGETLRLYSECTRVSREAKNLGQLAMTLLERNAMPGIHGRFAIRHGGAQIIYLQDQLLDTMDRIEMETHIRHIAEVTARFRAEFPDGS